MAGDSNSQTPCNCCLKCGLRRRYVRYPLYLPVSLKIARKEIRVRSEDISLGGTLLSSAFLILQGSKVELTFGIAQLSDPFSIRGKVLRVQPNANRHFGLAISFERPLELDLRGLHSGSEAS